MQKILALHALELQTIQKVIEQNFQVRGDHIRPVNFDIEDERIMTFQLSFDYPQHDPEDTVLLNFQLRDQSPQTLFFEALAGLKGYEKANDYHGLEGELIKYIKAQIL